MVRKEDRTSPWKEGFTPAQRLEQKMVDMGFEKAEEAHAAQRLENKTKGKSEKPKDKAKDANKKTEKTIRKDKAGLQEGKIGNRESQKDEVQVVKWSMTVSNAISGETIGQYLMAPTDLVQDLKDRVESQLCPGRSWAANGRLLHQTQVLSEALMLKEAQIQESSELQYLSHIPVLEDEGRIIPRSDVFLLPEVMKQVLDSCKLQPYQPKVQWVLDAVIAKQSQEELEQQWKDMSEEPGVQCEDLRPDMMPVPPASPWLQFREGHRGACRKRFYIMMCEFEKGVLKFSYVIFNNGSYMPVENPPLGWLPPGSLGDADGKHAAPLLRPIRAGGWRPSVDCFMTSSQNLALPCAILALQSEGYEVMEVVAADRLHGYGVRAGFDLVLAVKSLKTLQTSVLPVYFHPLMTSAATTIDDMNTFSRRYFDNRLFDDYLDAAVCESVQHVLVLWHIDLVQTLRWTLAPIPAAFRSFRRQLAKQWFPDSDIRIDNFNKLLQQQLFVQNSLEPSLLDLPKTVCANPSCPAGADCSKHHHLFQISVARICPGGDRCRRNRFKRPCYGHHCRGQPNPQQVGPMPCNCVQLWAPTATSAPWSPPKPKAKAKGKKDKASVDDYDELPKGLDALCKFLSSVRTTKQS
ncbi:unnamed protein product [Symbiodinium sp. CCMP2592]|nr:unnamed protein product [Symbiodinium sp. CCMP2592]